MGSGEHGESYRRQMLRCCISGQRLHCRGSGVEPPSYRSNPPPNIVLTLVIDSSITTIALVVIACHFQPHVSVSVI